jgi:hypothetical protein
MSSNSISRFFSRFRSKTADKASDFDVSILASNNPSDLPADHISVPGDDYSLIAVITAAVAMMMSKDTGSSAPYPGFRVKRIRRLM